MVAAAGIAKLIFSLQVVGLAIALALNMTARWYFDKRSEVHERTHHTAGENT